MQPQTFVVSNNQGGKGEVPTQDKDDEMQRTPSTKAFEQLSSSWPNTSSSPSLISRLFQAAQSEFSNRDGGPKKDGNGVPSPNASAHPSSRRQSHEGPSLSDTLVVSVEEQILDETYERHSRTFHMVLLDPTYHVFVSLQGHGSLIYKISHRTLVVVGDPLCNRENMDHVLEDLRLFRRTRRLKLAFMGVSESFREYAAAQGWNSFRFGCERVVNTLNNEVLDRKSGKRMLSQNRQLLDSKRGGIKLDIYAPNMTGINAGLEKRLVGLYDDWCQTKQENGANTQAFITAYDIFSQRTKTAFIYCKDAEDNICGMAMLRQLGAVAGFHIDPCIAAADAPRGITDLLMITAMQVLRRAEISNLSLGVEPCVELGAKDAPLHVVERLANAAYRRVTDPQKVSGKKSYNDKFKPDPLLESDLHVVFPRVSLPIQESLAIMKVAHVRPLRIFG